VEAFDLNRVHKAGAKFDRKKQMVQSPTFDQTRRRFGAYLRSIVASKEVPENVLIKIVSLIKERAHFVSEFWELSDFFFVAPSEWRLKTGKRHQH
jgi:glutamyl-tRNA synthetase